MAKLRELRQLVGVKTGDVLLLRATATSANKSSFQDFARLADREDQASSIVRKLLYFSNPAVGPNDGHEAAVTGFDQTTRTLSFSPDAPTIPQINDALELWSVAERIGSIAAVHLALNYGIEAVKMFAGPEVYAPAQTFNARTGELVIPDTWATFGGAEFVSGTSYRKVIRSSFLSVQPSLRTVRIRNNGAVQANGKQVYLYGYLRCDPLVNEQDQTPISTEWLVESAAEYLTLGRSYATSDPAAAERRAEFWSTKAANYRRGVYSGRRGLLIDLPAPTS